MGELLKGLYEDLLEFDDAPESAATKETVVKTESQQETEGVGVGQRTHTPEKPQPEYHARKQPRPVPFRPAHPIKTLPEVDIESSSSSKKIKYFIMKSNNSTNIDRSLATGVWSTQHHNEAKLADAFLANYEIRLIFSINQSGHFQGYAVMKSAIGKGPKHNIWVGSAWGGFFEIEWQLQYDFPFSRFEHLSNPLNEGKPVKFARDGQEVPTEVGNEMIRIMHDIARTSGIVKPVVHNQLKVEPYPEGRNGSYGDRRDYEFDKYRGGSRGGRGHRWGGSYYGRHSSAYPYARSSGSVWNESDHYYQQYPSSEYPSGAGHGDMTYGPSPGQKRPRSMTPLSNEKLDKPSLYDMTYEEYLDCYYRVQKRVKEVISTGELWKALGMIPSDYQWGEEDQRRIKESGWFDAWFGDLASDRDTTTTTSGNPMSTFQDDAREVASSSGSRVMTENE
eukprot:g1847.t2